MVEITLITSRIGLAHALQTALSDTGHRLTVVETVEALSGCELQTLPQVIILGETDRPCFDAVGLLKASPDTAHIPVLLHSDNFSIHNPDYVARLGVQAVLSAPLSVAQLLAEIDNCLRKTIA